MMGRLNLLLANTLALVATSVALASPKWGMLYQPERPEILR